jgi:hypothetical protein
MQHDAELAIYKWTEMVFFILLFREDSVSARSHSRPKKVFTTFEGLGFSGMTKRFQRPDGTCKQDQGNPQESIWLVRSDGVIITVA